MKKIIFGTIIGAVVIIFLIALFGMYKFHFINGNDILPRTDVPGGVACTMEAKICPDGSTVGRTGPKCEFASCPAIQEKATPADFIAPLDRVIERVTKKPFGILINPKTSPVQPERFSGYHTGTDFETFPDEQEIDIPIRAICSGKLLEKKHATGYGGVLVQQCQNNGEVVTVVYGHIALSGVSASVGETITEGSILGLLGKAKSVDTDGERKHLHLGIHRGSQIDIRGYVATQKELNSWIDSCLFVCK